jgi:hypothetical protein
VVRIILGSVAAIGVSKYLTRNNPTAPRSQLDFGEFLFYNENMKYQYKIIFDEKADLWNWFDAAKNGTSYGCSWRDNLRSTDDKQIYDLIAKNPTRTNKKQLAKLLQVKYTASRPEIDLYIAFVDKILGIKFQDSCTALAKISGRKLAFDKYKFYITTFPRCPYDERSGSLFLKTRDSEVIGAFMHEALHFQFHKYWRNDKCSPISKLSEEDFHYLKESLTVVLDIDVVPLIEFYDRGYDDHAKFRKLLHKEWRRHYDFDKLVAYGLKNLPKYKQNAII